MGNMLWKLGLLVQSALLVGCLSGNGFKPFGKESNSQDQTSTSSQNETPGEANLTGPNLGSPEGNSPGENSTNPPAPAPAPTPAPVPTPVCKSTPVMKKGQRMLGFWECYGWSWKR